MTLSRRHFNQFLLGGVAAAWLPHAFADVEEGRDWRAIQPPQPSDVPGKLEVLEFFSYGCPHCSTLNPLVTRWASELPEDVAFRRIPITFGRQAWANLSRLYYSLETMGHLERLDQDIFDALHEKRIRLYTEPAILDWLADRDVDAKRFSEIFNSFDVQTKVGRADYLANRYQINAVPTLAVGGRYVILSDHVKSLPELLTIADQLIAKARAETSAT